MKKVKNSLKSFVVLCFLFSTFQISFSQPNQQFSDVDFLNQQLQILKLDTSKSNIGRMEHRKQQLESTLGPLEKFVGESYHGFDTLKLAKLFVALYDNKYEEVLLISNKIQMSNIYEIKRLIFYSRVIANAHLNKPVECIDAYSDKIISTSSQCLTAIQFHMINNKIDFSLLKKQHDKITRRENLKAILIGGTGTAVVGTLLVVALVDIYNGLSNWNFSMF